MTTQIDLPFDAPSPSLAERVARRRDRLEAERRLREGLDRLLGGRLATLTLTRNRSTLISARWSKRRRGGIDVRLQGLFVEADEKTLRAVASICLGNGTGADHETVRRYCDRLCADTVAAATTPARRIVLRPQGRFHDLEQIQVGLLSLFDDLRPVSITWGRDPARRGKRRRPSSVLLGSYTHVDSLIRIHPVLDREDVPHYVVESVVHHEMLHAVLLPEECGNGRRRVHTKAFQERERLYPHFVRAETWLDANLTRLLRRFRA